MCLLFHFPQTSDDCVIFTIFFLILTFSGSITACKHVAPLTIANVKSSIHSQLKGIKVLVCNALGM